MKSHRGFRCLSFFALLAAVVTGASAFAADHRDAPNFNMLNPAQDINDIYVFQSPQNSNNVVFVITVNPFIGQAGSTGILDPNTAYDFKIDTNGDFVEDIVYTYFFSAPNGMGQQNFILQKGRSVLARGRTGVTANVSGGGRVLVSIFDDPFFFDSGVVPGMPVVDPTPNTDTFGNANISAMILEIPRRNLPTTNVNVWSSTERRGRQEDRTAIPGLNTVLVPDGRNMLADRRNEFNLGEPADDTADFSAGFAAVIMADFGRDAATAAAIADVLLPDVLAFDTTSANGFGPEGAPNLNGRRLEDDVIDVELQVLTGVPTANDGVDSNDKAFLNVFPYLASPHP
jgi:hypothetical protein